MSYRKMSNFRILEPNVVSVSILVFCVVVGTGVVNFIYHFCLLWNYCYIDKRHMILSGNCHKFGNKCWEVVYSLHCWWCGIALQVSVVGCWDVETDY